MYPQANIPVTQLSLMKNASTEFNFELGRSLAPLRDEGILIVTSGAITHNFGRLDWHAVAGTPPLPQAEYFSTWVATQLAARNIQAMLDYRSTPMGAESHPTEEHFMPLFVALGAAGDDNSQRFSPNFAYGGLSMDSYLWDGKKNQTLKHLTTTDSLSSRDIMN
jgi:4,5-DOPA dioxygenase extradiol